MRLAKYLAHGGVASRRTAERIVANGRVTVGGEVITDPARDVGEADDVRVDGSRVAAEPREVWAVNKPAGVVSTAKEPGRRPAVVELVASGARLYPVGRLDADSIGLLLLTNDGELANRLTHPRNEVAKAYRVELRRPPSDADLEQLRRGVELEDGPTRPAQVRRLGERRVEIVLREGRNRQVRRMAEVGWQRGGGAASRPFRSDRAGIAAARRGSSPRRGRDRPPLGGCRSMKVGAYEGPQERLFAVRGAAQAEANEAGAILSVTEELIRGLIDRNDLAPEAMVSCLFTTTDDLDAEFPALAARNLGLDSVPLLCAREIGVPGAMPRVVRVMVALLRADRTQLGARLPRRGEEAARRPRSRPVGGAPSQSAAWLSPSLRSSPVSPAIRPGCRRGARRSRSLPVTSPSSPPTSRRSRPTPR